MKVILISGKAGSGKDTLSDLFVSNGYIKIAFADPLKRAVQSIFKFSYDQLWGPSELRNLGDARYLRGNNTYLSPREALQETGEHMKRLYPNIWVDIIRETIESLKSNNNTYYTPETGLYLGKNRKAIKGIVVSDVRFAKEITCFQDYNTVSIKIIRDVGYFSDEKANHISEVEQDTFDSKCFDKIILNNKSIEDLKSEVDKIVKC